MHPAAPMEGEGMTGRMQPRRPRSVYCSLEERDAIRQAAAAAGKSVSAFVIGRALEDGEEEGGAAALTEEERVELRDGVLRLAATMGVPQRGAGEAPE
ncbi:MAG: DUF1778 domain-containing protein [Alphaproteobacteria bacterium]|nr:DUF1778 domain-containing protein [Alphaproteobacteria bacterium]